ncbi:MAG: zinc-dependent alcohol dehydrogenase family protein [Proteobacteria bacterium]|nr:zinc-binding alcohol dehydrogenase family protein [Pseudomonadota bacterium]NOG60159.1 zinc-dependent alcohol dehydrogenase family protein [Pseudomonadota bacterium]
MKAMRLHEAGKPLLYEECPVPECGTEQVLIKVSVCAVCRTDLHVCDGELLNPKLPLIPGHEIVGQVVACGDNVEGIKVGDRVGVPWLGFTCGKCGYCQSGNENLCDEARFTGYEIDGGYAEYTVAHQHFVFPLSNTMSDVDVAPLLCAGLIGYRSYKMTGEAKRLGIYGFGAAAHIIAQIAIKQGREVYAFTSKNDKEAQDFARDLGVVWAGGSDEASPELLDAAIIYAPVGELVPRALESLVKGGIVVCAGIHMSDIPSFPYDILWGERTIKSVANLTRKDGEEFLSLIDKIPVDINVNTFPLEEANLALDKLRKGEIQGAAVLVNS